MSSTSKLLSPVELSNENADNQAHSNSRSNYNRLWFVAGVDVMRGPFTETQLKEQIALGILVGGDYVWCQGLADWRVVGTLTEFFPAGAPVETKVYPTIKAPTGGIEKALSWDGKERRQVKVKAVSLTSGVRSRWSIYDWFVAVLVCLLFSYLGLWTTQRYVSKDLLRKSLMEVAGQTLGVSHPMGTGEVILWQAVEPVLSAPGAVEYIQNEALWIQAFDVKVQGDQVKQVSGQSVNVESEMLNHLPSWAVSAEDIDPIYRRPLEFRARAHVGSQGLRYRPASGGDPYLP